MRLAVCSICVLLSACVADTPESLTYDFGARGGGDSVSYAGQTLRQVLIARVHDELGGLTERLDKGETPGEGAIEAELLGWFTFDSDTLGEQPHGFETAPPPKQTSWNDISTGKDLFGKLAGNDPVGQHADWSTDLIGWDEEGVTTPESLLRRWSSQLDEAAVAWAAGDRAETAQGERVPRVEITAEGLHLDELITNFLHGAVSFSQATDDYLDDDLEGKGLLSDHEVKEEGASYTALEHAWDEGFGYLGMPRDAVLWSLDELAAGEGRDTVRADGAIDLTAEQPFAWASYAAKRDLGVAERVPTNFTGDLIEAFVRGRALLAATKAALSPEDLDALRDWRDQAVSTWADVGAANVVHYLNATLQDLDTLGTEDHDLGEHAGHWSEAKAFALALQFNPQSPLSESELGRLHDLIGQAPVLDPSLAAARTLDLLAARRLVADAHGFDDENLGDDHGKNGW